MSASGVRQRLGRGCSCRGDSPDRPFGSRAAILTDGVPGAKYFWMKVVHVSDGLASSKRTNWRGEVGLGAVSARPDGSETGWADSPSGVTLRQSMDEPVATRRGQDPRRASLG